jgi:hypothetical protein
MSDDIEALRRDAERYRFLRNMHWSDGGLVVARAGHLSVGTTTYSLVLLDEAVDSAVREAEKNGHEWNRPTPQEGGGQCS